MHYIAGIITVAFIVAIAVLARWDAANGSSNQPLRRYEREDD